MNITQKEIEIASVIDLMSFHCQGKTPNDVIPTELDREVFNVLGQDTGHAIIHLLAGKCLFTDTPEMEVRTRLAECMVQMFMLGVYMAEHGKANLGSPKPKPLSEIQ